MEGGFDSEILHKKVFSIINWLDFSFSQKFRYKNSDLTANYLFLYTTFLFYIAKNKEPSFDTAIKDYLCTRLTKQAEVCSSYNEKDCVAKIKRHFLFGNKTDFRYLLVSQVLYTLTVIGISADEGLQNLLREKLLFKEKEFLTALDYAKNPQAISDTLLAQSFSAYLDFVKTLSSYNSLRIAHIGVCATMSAGKSSFVNALLGYDYLPVRNEATTARVTSVYDNDHAKNLIGFALNGTELLYIENALSAKEVDAWNADSHISHIILQGDLDNIGNNGVIVAVHDTPGTNNSGDKTHHNVTMGFLTAHKMDAIVFVANAEHLCTTDEKALLKELHEKVTAPQHIPVVFVLNKADKLDSEKEDISRIIAQYSAYLSEIGFENAHIFPLSSRAARLLKMVKNGRTENLTGREKKELSAIQAEFSDVSSTGLERVESYIETITGGNND